MGLNQRPPSDIVIMVASNCISQSLQSCTGVECSKDDVHVQFETKEHSDFLLPTNYLHTQQRLHLQRLCGHTVFLDLCASVSRSFASHQQAQAFVIPSYNFHRLCESMGEHIKIFLHRNIKIELPRKVIATALAEGRRVTWKHFRGGDVEDVHSSWCNRVARTPHARQHNVGVDVAQYPALLRPLLP